MNLSGGTGGGGIKSIQVGEASSALNSYIAIDAVNPEKCLLNIYPFYGSGGYVHVGNRVLPVNGYVVTVNQLVISLAEAGWTDIAGFNPSTGSKFVGSGQVSKFIWELIEYA